MSPLQDLGPEGVWDEQIVRWTLGRNVEVSVGICYLFLNGPASSHNAARRDDCVWRVSVPSLRKLPGQGDSLDVGSQMTGDGEVELGEE